VATQAKTKQGTYRREYRHRLHEAVDRILGGPDWGDFDKWARQVLVDLGLFIRVAAPALDYEVGRIIAGIDRPLGHFPQNLSWEGAGLVTDAKEADDWMAAGSVARGARPPPETQQRALAALLRPIASVSCHSWLHDLAEALYALSFGEVLPLVERSARGLTGIGKGRTAWELRLCALAWVEFQVAAGKVESKTEALETAAGEFGRGVETVRDWRRTTIGELGEQVVQERLGLAQRAGELWRSINDQLGNGNINEHDRRLHAHFQKAYSYEVLKQMGTEYVNLPRKKMKGQGGK
jgi:hypothetical protein